jgi:hypothetical protein
MLAAVGVQKGEEQQIERVPIGSNSLCSVKTNGDRLPRSCDRSNAQGLNRPSPYFVERPLVNNEADLLDEARLSWRGECPDSRGECPWARSQACRY